MWPCSAFVRVASCFDRASRKGVSAFITADVMAWAMNFIRFGSLRILLMRSSIRF